MIQPANRVTEIQEYYFSRKLKEVAKLNAEGMDIISLAIGSPDMPPSKQTIDKLCEVANNPNAHGYQPTVGIPELRKAMAGFYKRWYDVDLDWATEIQPLIGTTQNRLLEELMRNLSIEILLAEVTAENPAGTPVDVHVHDVVVIDIIHFYAIIIV